MVGNPGIGKSYFALYCMYRAFQEERDVVHGFGSLVLSFSPSKQQCMEEKQSSVAGLHRQDSFAYSLLSCSSTLFIYDCFTRVKVPFYAQLKLASCHCGLPGLNGLQLSCNFPPC